MRIATQPIGSTDLLEPGGNKVFSLSGLPKGQATNSLHALFKIAQANLAIANAIYPTSEHGLPWASWLGTFDQETPTRESGYALYDSVELAGEVGLYEHIEADPDLEILYTGACAWEVRGVDAVARRRSNGQYVICEAKGTERSLASSPLYYLHQTQHKGRQLTWEWCWKSPVDMADHPTTAQAFLEMLEPMLNGNIERLLVVSRVARVRGVGRTGYATTARVIYREADLNK